MESQVSFPVVDPQNFSSRRRNHMLSSHRRDELISWMKEMLHHSFVLDAKHTYFDTFRYFEELIDEHRLSAATGRPSKLRTLVPSVGAFHTPLPLEEAFRYYDQKYAVTGRRHIPPTFNEIRHTLNLAQVFALKSSLRLITFDGDQTLYEDGGNFQYDSILSVSIRALLRAGVHVALVTAAGYANEGPKYEARLRGLLDGFMSSQLEDEAVSRFFVVGGECNFYLRAKRVDPMASDQCQAQVVRLVPVSDEEWAAAIPGKRPFDWPEDECRRMLDAAQAVMETSIQELRLRATIIRKTRGVGIVSGGAEAVKQMPMGHGSLKLKREALDEIVLLVQEKMSSMSPIASLPYCCFNGGRDAWFDIGNKRVGVETMQALLGITRADACLHVGDQFLNTGNDFAARAVSPCIWIINPLETEKILHRILHVLGLDDDQQKLQ